MMPKRMVLANEYAFKTLMVDASWIGNRMKCAIIAAATTIEVDLSIFRSAEFLLTGI